MNLLPQHQKDAIYQDILLRFFLVILVIASFLASIFVMGGYNLVLYIDVQIPPLDERLEQEQQTKTSKTLASIEDEISKLNHTLAQIGAVRDKKALDFPRLLRGVGGLMPAGVTVHTITFQGSTMNLAGHADTRGQTLLLKSNLEKDSLCSKVTSPIITTERDVEFSFNCTLH